jgi:hypothetical protein
VTPELAVSVRKLVAADSAAHGAQVCEQLSQHLARIIGDSGVRTLLARSASLTSARFPWLATVIPRTASAGSPSAALRVAMESQDPQAASEAFVGVLTTFVELLTRLIGDALVARLLRELWPDLFPSPAKGLP